MDEADVSCDDDDLALHFPGMHLVNVLDVVTAGSLATIIEVLRTVNASGARLESLRSARSGDTLNHKLRLAGLRPRQARTLSDDLAALPEVEHVRVEHCLFRT